ncbi:hypothetical protein ACODYM_28875 [Burkholderia gladioli]|uniref:hypothetical protein n=1 Tax=Burkholderia gladioli TaxID=28095 RepID=UPI003B5127B8
MSNRRFPRITESMLSQLRIGVREGDFQNIDAGLHSDIVMVVVRLEDADTDYEPGVELVKRIVALPKLIAALQTIQSAVAESTASIYDFGTLARDALKEAGIEACD